jgi:hypothetical protein
VRRVHRAQGEAGEARRGAHPGRRRSSVGDAVTTAEQREALRQAEAGIAIIDQLEQSEALVEAEERWIAKMRASHNEED